MKLAWIESNKIRDIAPGNPAELYHPDVAAHYDTEVPDDTQNGATWDGERWVNPPEPAPQGPGPAPEILTPRQIRMALTRAGLRQAVEEAVAAAGGDLLDWWEYSTQFERGHPLVAQMAEGLGISPEQVDGLWRLGATL